MADPNNADLINQIHFSEREVDALENKISNLDDSIGYSADYAVLWAAGRTSSANTRMQV
jgi:hypothetical protein